jgi:hypothetical protein
MADRELEQAQQFCEDAERRFTHLQLRRDVGFCTSVGLTVMTGLAIACEAANGWAAQPDNIALDVVMAAGAAGAWLVHRKARPQVPEAELAFYDAEAVIDQMVGLNPELREL